MEFDLIVVGSGSVGSATGYYATQNGLKVLMIDSDTPPHSNGSHHGVSRLIRCAYGEGAKYVPLVLRSRELWVELNQKTGQEILETCGLLSLGPVNAKFIKNASKSAKDFNLNVENLTAEEINKRWTGLTCPEDYVGIYEPDNGFLRSELAVAAYIKLSKEAGARQLFDCIVNSVEPIKDGGVEVVTNKGRFQARKVVVSAGTWVRNVLPNMPIQPLRKIVMRHEAQACHNKLPGLIVEMNNTIYYSFPADANGFKVGEYKGGQPINSIEELTPFGTYTRDDTEVDGFLRKFLPGIGKRLHAETCSYDMSPDEDFIIDTVPECNNLIVVTGLSGHGFKFTSALGEIAALLAQDKMPTVDVTAFSLKRFHQRSKF